MKIIFIVIIMIYRGKYDIGGVAKLVLPTVYRLSTKSHTLCHKLSFNYKYNLQH